MYDVHIFIELDDGKMYRKDLDLLKTMGFRFRFSPTNQSIDIFTHQSMNPWILNSDPNRSHSFQQIQLPRFLDPWKAMDMVDDGGWPTFFEANLTMLHMMLRYAKICWIDSVAKKLGECLENAHVFTVHVMCLLGNMYENWLSPSGKQVPYVLNELISAVVVSGFLAICPSRVAGIGMRVLWLTLGGPSWSNL